MEQELEEEKFHSIADQIENDYHDSGDACILIKTGVWNSEPVTRKVYKTPKDFRDKGYEYIKNIDLSLRVDFEIYEFD